MPPRDPDERPVGDEVDLRSLRGGAPAEGARTPDDDDLGRIGEILRSLSADDLTRDEPPPAVWQGIVARTGGAAAGGSPGPGRTAMDVGPDVSGVADVPGAVADVPGAAGVSGVPEGPGVRDVVPDDGPGGSGSMPGGTAADVGPGVTGAMPGRTTADLPGAVPGGDRSPPPLRSVEGAGAGAPRHARRRGSGRGAHERRSWGLAAAAAAAVVVLIVGGVALARRDDDSGGSVVASAELEPLPDEPTGAATPVRADLIDKGGSLQLDLSTGDLPAPAGFYEVWLIDTDISGMVSLGPARADGTYAVPADVDPTAFPIVDVSLEPPDGNPTHSGVSVLRGTLA